VVYVLIDCNRTQEYVFASRRLKGIRHASRLLSEADALVGKRLGKTDLIRALGGVVIARFEDTADAKAVDRARIFVREARAIYRGIGIGVEADVQETNGTASSFYERALRPLLAKVRELKDCPSHPAPGSPSCILSVPCETSGFGAAEALAKVEPHTWSRTTRAEACKWSLSRHDDHDAQAIVDAVRTRCTVPSSVSLDWPDTFEELVSWRNAGTGATLEPSEARQVGLLFADVNGLGRLLQFLARDETWFARFAVKLREKLTESLADASADVLSKVVSKRSPKRVPVRPLFIGGDDLCVAVVAPYALPLAAKLLETFERRSADLLGDAPDTDSLPPRLTLSAGVVVAPFKYPILAARRLGRELETRAKSVGRYFVEVTRPDVAANKRTLPSLVDFHVVKNSALGGLDVVRMGLVSTVDGQRTEWSGGPFLVESTESGVAPTSGSGAGDTFVKLDELLKAADELDAGLPGSKVHALRELLGAGIAGAPITADRYRDWCEHLDKTQQGVWAKACELLDVKKPGQDLPVRTRLPRSSAVLDAIDLVPFAAQRRRWEGG
jgi:hypothetical protein